MKLDRDLTGIYLTGLLFMMGNMLPNPIIAGYSVDLGATAVMMSVITGLNSIVAMICRPFVGNLADSINSALDNEYTYVCDRTNRLEPRPSKEIGISAVRGGTIVGDHDVIFAGTDEVITFSHMA